MSHVEHIVLNTQTRRSHWPIVRTAVGAILIVAALLKLFAALSQPVTDPWLTFAQVQLEWALGLWLVTGVLSRLAWLIAICVFVGFSGVNVYFLSQGRTSCGCLGVVQVSPWAMLIFDYLVVIALIVFRPESQPMLHPRPSRTLVLRAIVIWLLLAVPAGWLLAGAAAPELTDDGAIPEDATVVAIQADKWLDKPLPLIAHIDTEADLSAGNWLLVLHRHDCAQCKRTVQQLLTEDQSVSAAIGDTNTLILVQVPPFADTPDRQAVGPRRHLTGKLTPEVDWLVYTPTMMWLEDGVVKRVARRLDTEPNTPTLASSVAADRAGPPRASATTAANDSGVAREDVEVVSKWLGDLPLQAEPVVLNLGYVKSGAMIDIEFRLTNPLDKPLRITGTDIECICTEPRDVPDVIPAGESAKMLICFAAPDEVTNYAKRLFLTTDHPQLKVVTLRVEAALGLPLQIEPQTVEFETPPAGESRRKTVTFTNHSAEPVRLLYATSTDSRFVVPVPRDAVEPGQAMELLIEYTASEEDDRRLRANITVHTDSQGQRALMLRVRENAE